jgi:hypothetical protein
MSQFFSSKKKKRVTRTENRESTPLSVAHWPALLKAYGRIRTRTICLRQIHVDLAALSDQRHILGANQTLECVRHKSFINSILNQKVGAQEILRVLYHTRLLIMPCQPCSATHIVNVLRSDLLLFFSVLTFRKQQKLLIFLYI